MNRKLIIAFGCLLLLLGKLNAQAPVSDFTATPTSGCGPLAVHFTDLSTNKPLFWDWEFGDGQSSTAQNPSVSYANPGTYSVTLTTRNKDGSNTVVKSGFVTVFPYPTASFTSDRQLLCAPAAVQFTDHSTPAVGIITSWIWNLGDGTSSTDPNPSHTYTQPGYYNISLTVANSGGCKGAVTQTRYLRVVDGIQPNFAFDQTSNSCSPPFVGNFLNQTAGPGNLTYNWNFGTGATPISSGSPTPTNISYPTSGSYTVTLQVQSDLGCSNTIQKTIPLGNYTVAITGPDTACVNTAATWTNGSSPAPSNMTWNFGDGSKVQTASPVTKTYSTAGNYTLQLVNKYGGCIDSISKLVHVLAAPVPDFTADRTAGCQQPLTVSFTDATTGSPVQWLWDFGDGSTSTSKNPQHTYTQTGTFDVKLTVTGAGGCPVTTKKTAFITIKAPVVNINGGGTLGTCIKGSAGDSTTINPTATINSIVSVTGYNWSAPGSNEGSSTSPTPTFTYNTAGDYTISLTVTFATGCTSSPVTTTVKIGTPVTTADFDFTFLPTPVCGRDTVTFAATSTTPIDAYRWTFGDGATSGNSNVSLIRHSYGSPSNFKVLLTAITHGCPFTRAHFITVNPPFPTFGYKVTCGTNNVHFIDSSNLGSGTTTSYKWDFGDGATETDPIPSSPSHSYAGPGVYTVSLTIVEGSCTQTWQRTVALGQITPSFIFLTDTLPTNPVSVCKNATYTLKSTSTVNTGNINANDFITLFAWQVTPHAPGLDAGALYSNANTANGPETITLTVTDSNGCSYSTAPRPVLFIGPTSHFTSTGGSCRNSPIAFTSNSNPDPANNAAITGYQWNFGDSSAPGTGSPVNHSFADTGYYHVALKVTDANGCTDIYTPPDSFHITAPYAAFSGPDSFYCPRVPLTFIDSSVGYAPLTELWNFGDGNTSATPTNTYATSGQTYNVKLKVTDSYGCSDSVTKPVRIQKPIAAFNIADTTAICFPLQTEFTSKAQFIDSLYWDFGDGTTSTLPITSHFYNNYGTYTAILYTRGPGGCFDTVSRHVIVEDPFNGTIFSYSPLQACDSVPVQFNIVPPGYTLFSLLYGDGASDTTQDRTPLHMYRKPNTYYPRLTLEDSTGCFVSLPGANGISVLGATPFFAIDKHSFCDSSIVNFSDFTRTNDGISSETWTFGDNSPPQTDPGPGPNNATHYFNVAGTWPVTLKVVTNSGCTESYSDTVHAYQTPHPIITVGSIPCAGIIQFEGSLTAPQVDTINWNWNFGNGQTSHIQDPAILMTSGNFHITLAASVSYGCNDTTSHDVTINPLPEIKGPREIVTPLGIPITIPLTYSSSVTSWIWAPGANLDCATCPNPVATLLLTTLYTVTVTDTNNCRSTDSILIKTVCNADNLFMPNTFSPNGDGVNDVFYPRGKSLYNVQSLSVFNRWGQMVFQRKDFPANTENMGWDGKFNGHPAPSDAYVYIVEVICQNAQVIAIHGTVTLLR